MDVRCYEAMKDWGIFSESKHFMYLTVLACNVSYGA